MHKPKRRAKACERKRAPGAKALFIWLVFAASSRQGAALFLEANMKVPAGRLAIVLAAGIALAGCASTAAPTATGSSTLFLAKTNWVAEDVNKAGLIDNSRVTLSFSGDDKIAGSGGCNRFFGGYREADKALTVSGIGSTKMACAPALMDQEGKYLSVLGAAKSFALNDRGGLVITAGDGRTVTFRPDGS
jgi:heat shock protein HslJ